MGWIRMGWDRLSRDRLSRDRLGRNRLGRNRPGRDRLCRNSLHRACLTWGLLAVFLAVSGCAGTPGGTQGGASFGSQRATSIITGSRPQPVPQTAPLPPLTQNDGPVLPGFRLPGQASPQPEPELPQASTAAPTGLRVAILAPLSGPNAALGQALVRAAQLALEAPGSPALDVQDTQGTAAGAAAAASAAIAAGAGLILGPLTAAETAGAAAPASAANVGLLAFTTDVSQQRPLVWVLGLTPAQQVRRLVAAAAAQGHGRFAALLPTGDYGAALGAALAQTTSLAGLPRPDIRQAEGGVQQLSSAVRDISGYAGRRGPLEAQIRAARARQTPEGRKEAAELSRKPIPPPPFDALLLGDTGERLASLASLLPYYDIDAPAVRIMGPALWANPAARGGVELFGAWYAAPDPAARGAFDQQYSAKFGAPAPGIADIANDAASIARVVAQDGGFSAASLTRPGGFAGVNGLLTLQPDGSVRRGLALFEIQRGGPRMIEPAPDQLGGPGT